MDATTSTLIDRTSLADDRQALEFMTAAIQAATECSIVCTDRDGLIQLWNEGAARRYGYRAEDVLGKASVAILHVPEDVASGKPREILESARANGKWEGAVSRIRRNGERFTAQTVVTPRRTAEGETVGFLLLSKDVSETIRLAEELKASQFYTRSLIESDIDALMTTDPLGIITDVNQQLLLLTGYAREELIGSAFRKCFTDPAAADEGIKLVLREGRVANYELTALARDGRTTRVSYNASTFRDAAGKLQGVIAAVRDITEQKKLEGQLRDSEAYNRGLIEASVDGLVTVDQTGLIRDVNEQMSQMTGFARDELIGSQFAEYFIEMERAEAEVAATFDRGVVTDSVLTLVTSDGEQRQVSFNASVFKDQAGEVRGIFASVHDVTNQARLQAQLSEERAYNRGLIEASLDGLFTVNPDGFLTDVNEQMCRLTGYDRAQLVGSSFKHYFTEPERVGQVVKKTFVNGAVTNYELELRTKSGRRAILAFNATVFRDAEGRVQGIFASARDISEQARLQQELDEQQLYNRSLIEASADALFAIAPDGLITDVNEESSRLTGYTRKQLIGSRFATYFTDSERARLGVQQTLDQGRVIGFELVLITRSGKRIALSFNAGVFTDAVGTNLGILAAARDNTEPKRLEQQLRDQQIYTRSLIESNIDALMTTDPLGIITDVNQQMEQLTGCSRGELIGSPFKFYFSDPLRAEDGIRQVLCEGKVTNYELTARAKNGQETVVSYNATTFNDQAGKLQGVFAAARDVTERKRAELLFRGLLESAPDAMVIVNQKGQIVLVNTQTEQLFGYSRQELLGQLVEILIPKRHQMSHPAQRQSYFQQPRTRPMGTGRDLFGMRKDGSEFPVEISLSPLETDEGVLVSSSIRDITEHKRTERAIQDKNVELENAIQAKDRFLASMSHELRTPLNAIIGFTGTLLMKFPGPLNDEQEDQLQTVERSATHLLSLINDLLDMAKIDSGKVELNLVPVACQSVIDEVIGALKPMAVQKRLNLSVAVPDREVLLRTDRRALTQILLNLTTNALKFTDQGMVHIQLRQRDESVGLVTEISVADSGIGIRAEDRNRLFQAFQQIRGKGQATQQGTGLGLHVSQKLARLLGGEIHLESEPDKGSIFTLAITEN